MKRIFFDLLEQLIGQRRKMEELFGGACVKTRRSQEIKRIQKKTLCRYLLIALAAGLLLGVFLLERWTERHPLQTLERPGWEEQTRHESLRVFMSQDGERLTQNVLLPLSSEKMSKKEVKKCLEQFKKQLPQRISGKNPGCEQVSSDLFLPTFDEKTGIGIHWESSRPDLISEQGTVHALAVKKPEQVTLAAQLELMEQSAFAKIPVTVVKPTGAVKRSAMQRQLKEVVSGISRSREGSRIRLPTVLEGGVQVEWKKADSLPFGVLFFALCILGALVFQQRYRSISIEVEREREEMKRDFPDFLNKLVLMLSAGMVTANALERLALEGHRSGEDKGKGRPLYDALFEMCQTVHQTNAPMAGELKRMAKQSGLREIMRFAAIVEDNLSKGSVLLEKLSAESELLWMNRKKNAQELGRLAETKLILPMMILLLVLLILTAGPAMMTMNG